jgi:hypothetical protein
MVMTHILKGVIAQLLILLSVTGYSQNTAGCSSFKKGHFAYRDSATNTIREFKRSGKRQVETDKRSGLSTYYRIDWINDCEYKLTQVYANTKEARKRNHSSLTYRIVSTTENSYSYQCTCSDKTEIHGRVVKMQ